MSPLRFVRNECSQREWIADAPTVQIVDLRGRVLNNEWDQRERAAFEPNSTDP